MTSHTASTASAAAATTTATATATATTTGNESLTPPRNHNPHSNNNNNNNYAHSPTLTPIASIKRPRSSEGGTTTASTLTPKRTVESPLHPPKLLGRSDNNPQVSEAIFSPNLHHQNHNNSSPKLSDNDSEASLSVCDITDDEEFNPWQFIQSLPPYETVCHLTPPVALPPRAAEYNMTVVLDLDETLVHCTVETCDTADFSFPVQFHGMDYQVQVKLRPHLGDFLERIWGTGKFEVIVFTASQKVYADELLNRIDPDRKYFHHRLFRESCLAVEGNFLKDLTVLGRDLQSTVLVDNSPHAFGYQISNGIPIESWFDDPHDRELLKLEKLLRQLVGHNVQTLLQHKFDLARRVQDAPAYPEDDDDET